MPSLVPSYLPSIWSTLCSAFSRSIQILRLIFIVGKGRLLDTKGNNATINENKMNKTSGSFTITVQYQMGLDIIGVGAAGQVYHVDDDIVLKACRIYEPPSSDASPRARWDYASETIFHFGLLQDERTVFRLLAQHPHPNIVEAIDTCHPEGIYLRKYRPFSTLEPSSQSDRILWYRDIIRALRHLHSLGIAHSDIRKDNILFEQGHAVLGDFGASCPFGYPNPSLPVLLNGPSETVSDATDRFAIGSLIYEMETGIQPKISVNCKELTLPLIHTGHGGFDSLIENSWRGRYNSTTQMLEHVESLNDGRDNRLPVEHSVSSEELLARIKQWRKHRMEQHGCILYSLPTEDQLRSLADQYGWDINGELSFRDLSSTIKCASC